METETISKLFLELSQFTDAKTAREISLEIKVDELASHVRILAAAIRKDNPDNGPARRAISYLNSILA